MSVHIFDPRKRADGTVHGRCRTVRVPSNAERCVCGEPIGRFDPELFGAGSYGHMREGIPFDGHMPRPRWWDRLTDRDETSAILTDGAS